MPTTPRQPLPPFIFDSAIGDGQFTRLKIDPNTASLTSIGMYASSNPSTPVFEFPFSPPFPQPPAPIPSPLPEPPTLFIIQFARYDLQENKLYNTSEKLDIVNYIVNPHFILDENPPKRTYVQVDPSPTPHWIVYDNVHPAHYYTPNVQDTIPITSPIKVVLRFRAATGPEEPGWIDLTISFTYPPELTQNPAKYAWQTLLIFPQLKIDKTKNVLPLSENTLTADWSVLFPGEDLGNLGELSKKLSKTTDLVVQDMLVQYAALYKTDQAKKSARGIALAATDIRANKKSFFYSHLTLKDNPQEIDPTADALSCSFTSPIFLKDQKYVQPVDPVESQYNFTLSRGDNYGFGGGGMYYRIKAFEVHIGADAPVDWMDVAEVYRKWVKANRPYFFSKEVPRTANSPMDNMSPFTVIANYGLDGPISPTSNDPRLPAKWLEIHPIKIEGRTDVTPNDNVSLQDRLKEMRRRANNTNNEVKLEAQIWGYGPGGDFQWVAGYPPITSLLSNMAGKPDRFCAAMDELAADQIYAIITTDFIEPLFNRRRFGGHVVRDASGQWVEAITQPFPSQFTDPAKNPNLSECHITTAANLYTNPDDPTAYFHRDRVFLLKQNRFIRDTITGCDVANELYKHYPLGPQSPYEGEGKLSNRFYQQELQYLCPQDAVLDIYLNKCLNEGAFNYGARLIEYMKTGLPDHCYRKDHPHIFDGTAGPLYNNVIGFGPWYVRRIQQVLKKIQDMGHGLYPNFALTHEFLPLEPLLRYINEYYPFSPVAHYVYAEAISTKQSPGDAGATYIHPGYKERRKLINNQPPTTLAPPDFMLTTDIIDPTKLPSRAEVLAKCDSYFNTYFNVERPGIAPINYDTGNMTTYTYNRCIEDVFNLKAFFFAIGKSAVNGERIYLHDRWFEPPLDPNEELIKMAVRASQLQVHYAQFLRGGYMLGRTPISDNRLLYTWFADFRDFGDAVDLNRINNTPSALGMGTDFISRGVDKDNFCSMKSSLRIQQMIWQRQFEGIDLRTLYLFANVGNTPYDLVFKYTKGLDLLTAWAREIRLFDGRDSLGFKLPARPALLGKLESFRLEPRSFAGVLISRQ